MKNAKSNKVLGKKGFTLVELAIVLVIIGLLIGGILVAQSMINTTRIQTGVRQLGQFDAAVANFSTKYDGLPGDTSLMGTGTENNDGWIDDSGTSTHTYAAFTNEVAEFWSDLSVSGMKTTGSASAYVDCGDNSGTGCSGALAAGALINTYIPKFAVGTNLGVLAAGASSGANYYWISSFSKAVHGSSDALTTTEASGLSKAEALAIDAKMDDGVGNTGNVTGVTTDFGGAITGAVYGTIATTPALSLVVRIGLQSGDIK